MIDTYPRPPKRVRLDGPGMPEQGLRFEAANRAFRHVGYFKYHKSRAELRQVGDQVRVPGTDYTITFID